MDIKYLKHNEIDINKWNICIRDSFNGIVYGYFWYLDILCSDWEALVEGDYESVMPLPVAHKYSVDYIFQPFFTQQLGVFSVNKLSPDVIEKFIQAIPSKYKYIEQNFNTFNKIENHDYNTKKNITYELDLIEPYESLQKDFATNTRRNIKKATELELTINKEVTPNQLINLFRNDKGQEVSVLKEEHYERLSTLITFSLRHQIGEIYGVFSKEKYLIAAAFFITSHNKTIFLFSASNEKGKVNRAMFLLIDQFIKDNSEKHLTLDFEGSNIAGLARFYSSFGAKACEYTSLKINNLPWYFKLFKH